jgi:hypothetical protein
MAQRNITDQLRVELATVERSYHELVHKNSDIMVDLIKKQEAIVDNTLGLKSSVMIPVPPAEAVGQQPLRRPNWNRIRMDYEAKKRNEFWQSRIEEVEAMDKKKETPAVQTVVSDVSS